jgi:hypothetical protein
MITPAPSMNRKSFLRIADSVALISSCAALGAVALELGIAICGVGLLALGTAFLAGDIWQIVRQLRDGQGAVPVFSVDRM